MPKVQATPLPLNHVFLHYAPGQTHGPMAEIRSARPPRIKPGAVASAFGHAFKQVRLLFSSQGARANAQHRSHLKHASYAMDDLLRELQFDQPSPAALEKCLHRMAEAAAGMSPDAKFMSKLYSARATVRLESLPTEELDEVDRNLALLHQNQGAQKFPEALQVLHRLVRKEQARREMLTSFQAALARVPQGSEAADFGFAGVLQTADLLMGKLDARSPEEEGSQEAGLREGDASEPVARKSRLAMELLSHSLDTGGLSLTDARLLMKALPSERQQQLLHSLQGAYEFHDATQMRRCLQDAIQQRQDTLEAEAIQAISGARMGLNAPEQTEGVATAVIALAQRWDALAKHCATHGTPIPDNVARPLKGLKNVIELELQKHQPDLRALRPEKLLAFASALDTLEIHGEYAEDVAIAADRLGIKSFPAGTTVFPTDVSQQIMSDHIASLLTTEPVPYTPHGQRPTGVTETMWKDLPRATYAIEQADGSVIELVSPSARLAQNAPELRDVLGSLQDELKLNANQLLGHSQLANQSLWVGLETLTQSPESPVRLPDGTPGFLMGKPSDTFTFRKGRDGEVYVRCQHELSSVSVFSDPVSPQNTSLDESKSRACFSMEYMVTADGKVSVTQPLVSSYVLVPAK